MGSAAKPRFDHKHFALVRWSRCSASQLLAKPKENVRRDTEPTHSTEYRPDYGQQRFRPVALVEHQLLIIRPVVQQKSSVLNGYLAHSEEGMPAAVCNRIRIRGRFQQCQLNSTPLVR